MAEWIKTKEIRSTVNPKKVYAREGEKIMILNIYSPVLVCKSESGEVFSVKKEVYEERTNQIK